MKSHLIIKITLAISIIISIGTVLGIVSYLVNLKKSLIVDEQPVIELITEPIFDVELNWKTYQNEGYGFEFEYPLSYTLKEDSVNYISLRKMENEKVKCSFNVAIEDNRSGTNDSKLTFEEFATELALENCAVDDPDKSVYCTEVTEIKPFINENKISGYEIYLNEATEDSLNNKISNRIRGPIFVMDVIEQTYTRARGIFFDFGDEEEILEQEKQKLIDQVVSTFKFIGERRENTTNWKTYKNEKYGYEFRYPHEWNVTSNDTNSVSLNTKTERKSIYGGVTYGGIGYCGTLEQGQSLKNFVEENYSGAGLGSDSEIEEFINGYNTVVSITPSAHIYIMRETKSVYFENNREVVSLFFTYNVNFGKYPEHKHMLDLFNQVLFTFKFTEK